MKKAFLLSVIFLLAFSVSASAGQMGPGMMGGEEYGEKGKGEEGGYGTYGMPGWGCGYGPGMMGGYGYGPGMMGGYGYGPGMMGGYGYGPGMMGGYGYGMGPGMMGGYGYGPWAGYGGYYGGPEMKKFLDETRALRREMHMKRFEYMEELRKPDADREKLEKMRNEMRELREKMYGKAPKGY